jgi:4'-phosphopantetheinyl transferase
VWWATTADRPWLRPLLDEDERHRAARLRRTLDRDRYVTAHALVRILLGHRTGVPPEALRFDTTCRRCGGDHGKPRLAGAERDAGVAFNLAHAGNRVVVAVTTGADVGVDVESARDFGSQTVETLSAEILSPVERAHYAGIPSTQRARALAVWWTRKEAVLKATGDGLAVPPSLVTVTPPWAPPAVTSWDPGVGQPSGTDPVARLRDLGPGGPYVACVAVMGAGALAVTEGDADELLRRS